MVHSLTQSIWERANEDWRDSISRPRSKLVELVGTIVFGLESIILVALMQPTASTIVQGFTGLLATVTGTALVLAGLFIFHLVTAPFRQLHEVRNALTEHLAHEKNVRASEAQFVDEVDNIVSSLRAQRIEDTPLTDIFLKMVPMLGYELDQGKFAVAVETDFKLKATTEGKEGIGYQVLGMLEALGVVERKHPGDPFNQGHWYVRSVFITDLGRKVLYRLTSSVS